MLIRQRSNYINNKKKIAAIFYNILSGKQADKIIKVGAFSI